MGAVRLLQILAARSRVGAAQSEPGKARRERDIPSLAYAKIDPGQIPRGKVDFDMARHYSRADMFAVDNGQKAAVSTLSPSTQNKVGRHRHSPDEPAVSLTAGLP
jgi:hypothetical protein